MYSPNEQCESQLYVISWQSSQDICKIGRTTNVSQRFNQFLTAHHDPLVVHCLCSESIMSEANLHQRHESQRVTLEHFNYTEDLQETVKMINASTGFKSYVIPRTVKQTGTIDDCSSVEQYKIELGIPPLRLSSLEKSVGTLAAIGMTINESAEVLEISDSAVKSHRNGLMQKTFAPNLVTAISKLFLHDVITKADLSCD